MNTLSCIFRPNMFNNKITPVSHSDEKYYELLKRVNSGDKLSNDDIVFVWGLPREHLLVILKLYNLNAKHHKL
jgi:hypothetical protein